MRRRLAGNRFLRFNSLRLNLPLARLNNLLSFPLAPLNSLQHLQSKLMRSFVPAGPVARRRSFPCSQVTAEAQRSAIPSSPKLGAPLALVARWWGRRTSFAAPTAEPSFKQLRPTMEPALHLRASPKAPVALACKALESRAYWDKHY